MATDSNSINDNCSNDAEIIKRHLVRWLLTGGLGFRKTKDAIGNEVLFSRNWRRADLLVLSKEFHALEIKSDADSLSRLTQQLADYHQVFDRVSVVTTDCHLQGIQQATAKKTGIILLTGDKLEVVRQARLNKRLDKLELSKFLDKVTLNRFLGRSTSELSTDELRHSLVAKLSIKEVRRMAYDSLLKRYRRLFELFLNDIGDNQFGEDELRGLCGNVDTITL